MQKFGCSRAQYVSLLVSSVWTGHMLLTGNMMWYSLIICSNFRQSLTAHHSAGPMVDRLWFDCYTVCVVSQCTSDEQLWTVCSSSHSSSHFMLLCRAYGLQPIGFWDRILLVFTSLALHARGEWWQMTKTVYQTSYPCPIRLRPLRKIDRSSN
jgi:hypothetical protein